MAKQKRNEESTKALAKDTKAASSRKPSALRARETPNPKGQDMREIKPQDVTAIIDTREQSPLDVSPLQTAVEVLDTGDYSAKGLETVVRIERKSLPDLVAC
ncbi:MAG: hypothetical protein JNK57_16545, partial [Planctomycetaceae bacterium]|nr:hypothetical protein [Planctomycetaceae bacterium]